MLAMAHQLGPGRSAPLDDVIAAVLETEHHLTNVTAHECGRRIV